jgi:hypothetical protein
MSLPNPKVFFIAVYREDVPGPQHKVFTSISGLTRFVETELDNEEHNLGLGPFDVFVVNVEAMECGRYDLGPLLSLYGRAPAKKKARAKSGS